MADFDARNWDEIGIPQPATGPVPKRVIREALRVLITPHLKALVEAQVAQACGIKYLVARDESGKFKRIGPDGMEGAEVIEVWEKDPSTAAFTDLINRAADKPKEQEQEIILTGSITEKVALARARGAKLREEREAKERE